MFSLLICSRSYTLISNFATKTGGCRSLEGGGCLERRPGLEGQRLCASVVGMFLQDECQITIDGDGYS